MRGKQWLFSPIILVLLLTLAYAQKDNSGSDSSKSDPSNQNPPVRRASNTSPPLQPSTSDSIPPNHSNQPTDQPKTPATPPADSADHAPAPSPYSENMPPPDPAEIAPPRRTLPVILNSDSPALDRFVQREDIHPIPNDYVIGEEDVLTITIWKEHDLSGTMVVRPDGKITVPLVGEVNVVGMKPVELQALLEDRLKPFVTVPQVSISVNQINSRKIYLIGQVVREGTFPINTSMTVLQVLSAAGGLRDFAKRKKIYILRKQGDEEIRFPFNYDAAIHGRNREQNILVQPGDTIVVP